ncbi:MAG: hypothetical protein V7461_14335, partial [Maribacter arcticus]
MKNLKIKKYLKLFGKIILSVLILFFILVLVIRTPWAQNLIVSKVTKYISDKTNTKVAVGNLFLTFSGDLKAEKIYLEDVKGDTLFYSESLQADISIYPVLFKNQLSADGVISNGVVANISRTNKIDDFNFSFLIEALTTTDDSSAANAEPMKISLGNLNLSDWKLNYNDAYLGTDIKLILGKLAVDVNEFDLEKMKFSIDEFSLNDTQFSYLQSHPFPVSEDTTSTLLPYIEVDEFSVNNLLVNYNSKPDGLNTDLKLGTINLTNILANVAENQYETEDLIFNDTHLKLNLTTEETTLQHTNADTSFEWPKFILAANNIEIQKNSFTYTLNDTQQNEKLFEANAFKILQLHLLANNFEYQPEKLNLQVSRFSFSEPSGIQLNQLVFKAGITDTNATLSDLSFNLNQSSANAKLMVQFKSLKEVIKNPKNGTLSASISDLILDVGDVLKFAPELAQNKYLDSLSKHNITGSFKAEGNLKKVDNLNTQLQWGPNTKIAAKGSISNLTNVDSLLYSLNNINFSSTKNDIYKLISSKE